MNKIIEDAERAISDVLPQVQIRQALERSDYNVVVFFDDFYVEKWFPVETMKQPGLLKKLMIPIIDDMFERRLKTLNVGPGVVHRATENASDLSEP